MKIIFLIVLILSFGSVLFFYVFPKKPHAEIDGHVFVVEIATTPQEQQTGLAKYTKIQQNFTMYFPFSHPDYYTFWMKDMHFPIDILFLRNNTIVTIFSNVPVKSNYQDYLYKPTQPSDAVMEISEGLSNRYGFKDGDKVTLDDR